MTRLNVLNGVVNLGIAAFRDINSVYSPDSSKLIYSLQQRNYPSREDIDYSAPEYYPIEEDIDGKPKGVADSVAEVESRTFWTITDDTVCFTPTVYNMAYPNGNDISDRWITNFNPVADENGYAIGVESDILPLSFVSPDLNGTIKEWIFDTRHAKPSLGNYKLSGKPPLTAAMPLGNYGVIYRYYIDLYNTTNKIKNIT